MKLIMIFVFSYSLDVLTLMADKTPEFGKTETTTWDTAWLSEQSSNSFGSQDRFPSRQKRGLIKSCTGYYQTELTALTQCHVQTIEFPV